MTLNTWHLVLCELTPFVVLLFVVLHSVLTFLCCTTSALLDHKLSSDHWRLSCGSTSMQSKGVYGPITSLRTLLASTTRPWRAPPKNLNLALRPRSSCDWSANVNLTQNQNRFTSHDCVEGSAWSLRQTEPWGSQRNSRGEPENRCSSLWLGMPGPIVNIMRYTCWPPNLCDKKVYSQVSTAPWCSARNVGFTSGYYEIAVRTHSFIIMRFVKYLVVSGSKYILEQHMLFVSFLKP